MLRVRLSCCRLLHAFLLVLSIFCTSGAQDLAFRHYTVEDGLASATVYYSMQDDNGYLWFTTESGVNRFNGKKFELFSVDDGLADSEVFSLFQDKLDRIWFLSYNGHFSYFLNEKIYNSNNKPFLKKAFCGQSLTGAKEDGKGRLWFSTSGNTIILIEGEKVTKFNFPQRSYQAGGVNVLIRPDGKPEFRYTNKIFIYDESSKELKFQRFGIFNYYFQRPTQSECDSTVKIVREGIILRYGNQLERLLIPQPAEEDLSYFYTVLMERNNSFWVGTSKSGLLHYILQNDTIKLLASYLPDLQINCLTKDHEGNLWISTKENGVFMLPVFGRHTIIYPESKNFPTGNIYTVFRDSRGRIWTGGEHGIITCLDSTGAILKNYKLTHINSNDYRVVDILEDSAANIWIATNFSTHKIDAADRNSVISMTNNSIIGPKAGKSISVSRTGEVYVAFHAGLVKYNNQSDSFDLLKRQGYPTRTYFVYSFLNRVLVANINGLCEYKNDTLIPLYSFDERLRNRISGISSINDSTVILATSGHGIYVFRNDTIVQHINTSGGLPSNDCRSLFVDGNHVWVATVKGLAKFQLVNNRLFSLDITHILNGIYSNDIRKIFISKGKIYCASSLGLIVLNGVKYVNQLAGPPVLFLSLEANNDKMSLDSAINLRYRQNNLSINFEALSFNNPGQVVYEYSLQEHFNKIEQTRANEIEFSWLPPGTYNLLIRAKIGNGSWGPVSKLSFNIAMPFWQTTLFRLFVVIILIGLISLPFYMFYKRRIRNRWLELDKLAAVNRERQRISYDLHDDLGSSLTSITMNAEIIKHKKLINIDFSRELDDLSVYANDANEKMSDIVWAVSVSKDNLASLASYINEFITDYQNRTGTGCFKKIDEKLDPFPLRPEARKNIFLTVKEAFHNIQKHASATRVVFELFVSNHILNITIRDNGKGFEEDGIQESSVGLISMRKRMESIDGEVIIVSQKNKGTDVMLRYNLIENVKK